MISLNYPDHDPPDFFKTILTLILLISGPPQPLSHGMEGFLVLLISLNTPRPDPGPYHPGLI